MSLAARVKRLERLFPPPRPPSPLLGKYAGDPAGYTRDVLRMVWWEKQREAAEALLKPPYRVMVKASHKVGKTFLAGGLVNWWYDTWDPGLVMTTAPTDDQVRDLLWKEVRVQRGRRGGFRGPKMPRLESAPDHWAYGFTTATGESFQGRHAEHMLIVFDEAQGVKPAYWTTAKSMFASRPGHAWLCIYNPTDTSSQAYQEEQTGDWHVITMNSFEHPNIAAELSGQAPPFPAAVRLSWVEDRLREWCTVVVEKNAKATDIRWPPVGYDDYATNQGKEPVWLRPGPLAEARVLGRWPTQGTYGVWSDGDWAAAEAAILDALGCVEIGCDVARFGDDWTAIHVRRGGVSLHHEAFNGWNTSETSGRLKELAREYGPLCNEDPKAIPIKIDDDGVGGGVVDQGDDYCFIPVSAASTASNPNDYPNRRSELWFVTAERARAGLLSLAQLPREVRRRLKQQAVAPKWKLNWAGQRVVDPKEKTKDELGRSPDDMDAMNLAYLEAGQFLTPEAVANRRRDMSPARGSAAGHRGLFGRRE